MRWLYYIGEYGNYGGPGYGSVECYYDENANEYKYTLGAEPQDGLDTIYMEHDKAYALTDHKLQRREITQTEALLETMEADARLINESLSYRPYDDPNVNPLESAFTAAYQAAAITAFTAKLAYDMDRLLSSDVSAAIAEIALVTVDTILDTTPEMSARGILVTSNTAAVTKEITFLRYLL